MVTKLNIGLNKIGVRLPRPQHGINSWQQGAVGYWIKQIVDTYGNVGYTKQAFNMLSVIQPLKSEEIKYEQERANNLGQMSWEWYWFHTLPGIVMKTNDRVEYKNTIYKIMAIRDYSDYGHIEYRVIKDWQNESSD